MKEDLAKQRAIYEQQQTPAGKIAAANLADMARELRTKTGVNAKGGRLTPVRNYYTGKVAAFIED